MRVTCDLRLGSAVLVIRQGVGHSVARASPSFAGAQMSASVARSPVRHLIFGLALGLALGVGALAFASEQAPAPEQARPTEYSVLVAANPLGLRSIVNDALRAGWQLEGGVSGAFIGEGGGSFRLWQAIAR